LKVFISWSGPSSKKVAFVLKDWIPSVIQAVEPFLSSEDIEKGNRWNTDIARELQESTFGIICVTRDNLGSQWLNFEAGALSKVIENTHVAPFLLDVKPSDLGGSPISQFQTTSFDHDDVRQLIQTLNAACSEAGASLTEQRLDSAFETWWPQLEKQRQTLLEEIPKGTKGRSGPSGRTPEGSHILEEILETSRNTQRLLGNTDTKLHRSLETLAEQVSQLLSFQEEQQPRDSRRIRLPRHTMMLRNIVVSGLMSSLDESEMRGISPYLLLMVLSPWKADLPWLYDATSNLAAILMSGADADVKSTAIGGFRQFMRMIVSGHPAYREFIESKEQFPLVEGLFAMVDELLLRGTINDLEMERLVDPAPPLDRNRALAGE
jgi:hypothetical protein